MEFQKIPDLPAKMIHNLQHAKETTVLQQQQKIPNFVVFFSIDLFKMQPF